MDTDSDGLTDGQEFENATHPQSSDTDGDGMTDLWELTGPAPSDPCGVEGTPPNLSDLQVTTEEEWEWRKVGVGPLVVPLYVCTRNELNITVTATDNVGLSWIRFHIDGKGEQRARFAQDTNNSTVTVFFDHDLWSQFVSGYDLNITASDVNGNEGYLEFHIDSVLEAFVQMLIGALTALAEFVMELASAAIKWIWNFINSIVSGALEPLTNTVNQYVLGIHQTIETMNENIQSSGNLSDADFENISSSFFSPFFVSICIIVIVVLLIIKLITYFAPYIAGLAIAVMIAIFTILALVAGITSLNDDEVKSEDEMSSFNIPEITSDFTDGLIINSLFGEGSIEDNFRHPPWLESDYVLRISAIQFIVDLIMTLATAVFMKPLKKIIGIDFGLTCALLLCNILLLFADTSTWTNSSLLMYYGFGIGLCVGSLILGVLAFIKLLEESSKRSWVECLIMSALLGTSVALNGFLYLVNLVNFGEVWVGIERDE